MKHILIILCWLYSLAGLICTTNLFIRSEYDDGLAIGGLTLFAYLITYNFTLMAYKK